MRRTYWTGLLAVGLLFAGGEGTDVEAFGRGLLKRRAKREAKRRAKREAEKKLAEATGLDVDSLAAVAADPKAALQGQAEGAVSDASGVDIGGLVADPQAALQGQAEGAVSNATGFDVSGGAAGLAGSAKARVMDMAAGMLPPELQPYAGMDKRQVMDSVRDQVYQERKVTRFSPPGSRRAADAIAKKRVTGILECLANSAGVAAPGNILSGGRAGNLPGSRAEMVEQVRAKIYAERGVDPNVPGFKKRMADKMVESRLKALFGN